MMRLLCSCLKCKNRFEVPFSKNDYDPMVFCPECGSAAVSKGPLVNY